MFSPESSEMSSGGDSRLSVDTVPDVGLGTVGGGSTMFLRESAEGPSRGDSPDPKRQGMEKKVEIYEEQEHQDFVTEDDEESEEDFVTEDDEESEEDDEESEEDFVTEDDEESEEEEMEIDEADDGMDKEINQVDDDGDSDYSSILELDNRIAYLKSIYDVSEEEDDHDVKKVNFDEIKKPEMSEKEIDEILENVERETGRVAGVQQNSDMIPYLLPSGGFEWNPPPGLNERSLEIYYMRLLPNVEYARKLIDPSNWNNLPDRDSQYVTLFSELNKCGLFEEKCYRLYLELPSTRRCEDMRKATEMAQDLKLGKLTGSDISNCLMDVFMVRDNIAAHKLKEEYGLYLLDCRFDQSLRPQDFAPKDPHPVFYGKWTFRAQQREFDRLMEKIGGSKMTKEECQVAIRDHHKKNYEENCTIRIRYIKLKRTIAKKLRLIPEDD